MHANCVPDNSGEQLDAVEDGDEDGSQDTKFPQQSQTHNQHWLNCKIAKKKLRINHTADDMQARD